MIKLSKGNKKLASNESVKFLIWNLPAVTTCPHRTPACESACYARKAERMYPNVLPCRDENLREAIQSGFAVWMYEAIKQEIKKPSYNGKQVLFRVHESGDFFSKSYSLAWLRIARALPAVQFLAYTKSLEFFEGEVLPDNFTLRASIWHDTPQDALQCIYRNAYPTYTAMSKDALQASDAIVCDCKRGCADCRICWNKKAVNVATAIH